MGGASIFAVWGQSQGRRWEGAMPPPTYALKQGICSYGHLATWRHVGQLREGHRGQLPAPASAARA